MKKILFEKAKEVRLNAYAPYSNFKVGASILSENNKIYTCCNVENGAYPSGTCAEQGAISAMIAGGCKQIKEILIIGDSKNLVSPCGACRQRISEFSTNETIVHIANLNGIQKTSKFSELLPINFMLKA
jgi:cytidine deaminase